MKRHDYTRKVYDEMMNEAQRRKATDSDDGYDGNFFVKFERFGGPDGDYRST